MKSKQEREKEGWNTFFLGFPMTSGKNDSGQSSPAIPVLQQTGTLSMTTAGFGRWKDIAELFLANG